jgi:hypothetical protein
MKNEEIKNMVDIMGLKPQVTYGKTNIKTLALDALVDHGGSGYGWFPTSKGLLINLFTVSLPSFHLCEVF